MCRIIYLNVKLFPRMEDQLENNKNRGYYNRKASSNNFRYKNSIGSIIISKIFRANQRMYMLYHVSNHLFKSKNYLFSHTNNFPYKNSIDSIIISKVSQTNQRYAYSSSITNHLFKSKNYLFSHKESVLCNRK